MWDRTGTRISKCTPIWSTDVYACARVQQVLTGRRSCKEHATYVYACAQVPQVRPVHIQFNSFCSLNIKYAHVGLVGNFSHLQEVWTHLCTTRASRHRCKTVKKLRGIVVLDIWWGTDVTLKIKQRRNGVSDIFGGTDAALQKNSEATVLRNMDEGTDAATQKKS
jgi:hypothetical protein